MKQILLMIALVTVVGCAEAKKKAQELKEPLTAEEKQFEEVKVGAEKGESKMQFLLGHYYENGKGTENDEIEAAKWYRKAAEQGNSVAQCYIGFRYWKGKGFPQDHVIAYAWIEIAAQGNVETAKDFKADLAKEMSSDQIAKAEALAEEMIKKNPKLLDELPEEK